MTPKLTQTRDVIDHLGQPRTIFSSAYKMRQFKERVRSAAIYVCVALLWPATIAFMQFLDYVDGVR